MFNRTAEAPGDSDGHDRFVTMRVEKTEIQRVLKGEPAFSQMFISHILVD